MSCGANHLLLVTDWHVKYLISNWLITTTWRIWLVIYCDVIYVISYLSRHIFGLLLVIYCHVMRVISNRLQLVTLIRYCHVMYVISYWFQTVTWVVASMTANGAVFMYVALNHQMEPGVFGVNLNVYGKCSVHRNELCLCKLWVCFRNIHWTRGYCGYAIHK